MNIVNMLQAARIFLVPPFTVLIAIYIGQLYGSYHSRKSKGLPHASVDSVVGTVLALLAFILAFTFQIASNHYDARKGLLLDEVTSIRKLYMQAGLIQNPIRSDTRKLLVEYVDLRIELDKDPSKLGHAMSRSQQILDTIWSYAETLAALDRSSETYSLYTASVNDLADNYYKRITVALEYRIPLAVLWVLFIITFLSMCAIGYQFGISGKVSYRINLLLAIIFAMVMFIILALDRPETGLAKINQKPMYNLQEQLHGNSLPK
jgi:hypothetical protein